MQRFPKRRQTGGIYPNVRRPQPLERLEARVLLSAVVGPASTQLVYLDWDGVTNVSYDGPVHVPAIDVPAFSAAMAGLAGHESQIAADVLARLNRSAPPGVRFTNTKPEAVHSTVYIGGDDSAFRAFGRFYGLAEKVDVGNADSGDEAFVFSDAIPESATFRSFVYDLARVVRHELHHLIGNPHEPHVPHGAIADRRLGDVAYAVGIDGANPVHESLTAFGYALFEKQFGRSQALDQLNVTKSGARNEDVAGENPFGDGEYVGILNHPSVRHFWGHEGADYFRSLDNGLGPYQSAPQRATAYFVGPTPQGAGIAAVYAAQPALAYDWLGHAAHLLQDMTVPAHVHEDKHLELFGPTNDPDPYHDWVDGLAFSKGGIIPSPHDAGFNRGAASRYDTYAAIVANDLTADKNLRRPQQLANSFRPKTANTVPLERLFLETASRADDFDSKEAKGQKSTHAARNGYDDWTELELDSMARELVPLAITRTAELYRYFFATVDDRGPRAEFAGLTSTNPVSPQRMTGTTIDLRAVASDQESGDSGVGKDKFTFEYVEVGPAGALGDWTEVALGLQIGQDHAPDLSKVGLVAAELQGKHGAYSTARFQATNGKTYAFRVTAEDGAGNRSTTDPYYVTVAAPQGPSVIELIDHSFSMEGQPLVTAKNAASLFADLLHPGNGLGVVSFSGTATTNLSLRTIDDAGQVVSQARGAIAAIQPASATAIGSGLEAAAAQLNGVGSEFPRVIVLLSDGESNTGPNPVTIAEGLPDGIRVYTIAYGSGADAATLQSIADATGGRFFPNAQDDLQDVYVAIFGDVSGEQPVTNLPQTIDPGETRDTVVNVAAGDSTTIGINWGGSDLDLQVVAPDGTAYQRKRQALFTDSFDTLGNWTADGTWGTLVGPHGPAAADSPGAPYAAGADSSLTLKAPLALPAAAGIDLSFFSPYEMESGYDFGRVEVTDNDGQTWTELTRVTGHEVAGRTITVPLDAYAGRSVRVRFRLTSDGAGQLAGWLVDDVTITAPAAQPAGVQHVVGPTYEFFRIADPAPGAWTARVTAVDVPHAGYDYTLYGYLAGGEVVAGPPTISVSGAEPTEPLYGEASFAVTVGLSAASTVPITVAYSTSDGSAASGADYTPASGTLTFAPGQTSAQIPLTVRGDVLPEGDETFFVDLSAATNATVAGARGTITIADLPVTAVAFAGRQAAKYTDEGGHSVSVSLKGPGSGQVLFTPGSANAAAILLEGTTRSSSLKVAAKGGTPIGALVAGGLELKNIDAKTATLTQGMTIGTLTGTLNLAALTGASVRASSLLNKVTIGAASAASVFVGVRDDLATLPDDPGDFTNPGGRIGQLTIRRKGRGAAFVNSFVAAASIDKLTLGATPVDNGGRTFGIAASRIDALDVLAPQRIKVKRVVGASAPPGQQDLIVRLL